MFDLRSHRRLVSVGCCIHSSLYVINVSGSHVCNCGHSRLKLLSVKSSEMTPMSMSRT